MPPPDGSGGRSRRRSDRRRSRSGADDGRGYHGNIRQVDIGKIPIPVVPVPKEKIGADGEPLRFDVRPPAKTSSRSGGSSRSRSSRASGSSGGSSGIHPNPSLHLSDIDEFVPGEAGYTLGKSKNKGKKSSGRSEKASKNKDIKAEPHSDWDAPRVKVSPSECPVTRECSDRGSKTRSDLRSRRRDSCKNEKEDLACDLFDCNSNMPSAGGQGRAKIPIVPLPEFPDGNDKANRRSRRSGSKKKEKGDLSLDLFDCNSKVHNPGGHGKAKIPVLPMPDSPDGKGHTARRSRRGDSGKKDKGDLSYDLFDCNTNVRNAGGKGKGKIPVLPPSDFAPPPPVKVRPPSIAPRSSKSGGSSRSSKSKGSGNSDPSSEKMAPDMFNEAIDVWPPPGATINVEPNEITVEPEKATNAKASEKLSQAEKVSRAKKEAKKGNKSGKAQQGLKKKAGKPKGQKKHKD